jgi:hypothetical protein
MVHSGVSDTATHRRNLCVPKTSFGDDCGLPGKRLVSKLKAKVLPHDLDAA